MGHLFSEKKADRWAKNAYDAWRAIYKPPKCEHNRPRLPYEYAIVKDRLIASVICTADPDYSGTCDDLEIDITPP